MSPPPKAPPPKQPPPPPAKKMIILRGNSDPDGTKGYPDEYGKDSAWPIGALHVWAATLFAKRKGYEPVVLDISSDPPQNETSHQTTETLNRFLTDDSVKAFYGFSGGGYNVRYILNSLAKNHPETLERIEMVVVLGAPKRHKWEYDSSTINDVAKKEMAKKHIDPAKTNWKPGTWGAPIYGTNPPASLLPKYVPKGTDTHMFGPDVLLYQELVAELTSDASFITSGWRGR